PPIQVEVLLRRGILAMWQFQFEAADEALAQSFYTALAAGHDQAAADAISRRLYIQSNRDPQGGGETRRLGDALIQRVHDQELEATYYNNVGVLAKEAGESAAARVAYRKSLEIKRRLYGNSHLEVGYTLSNLGGLDVDEGYYKRATERFVDAVAIFREILGPEHFQTGALLSNLANVYARDGRWKQAAESYESMDAIFAAFPKVWSEMGPYILPDRGDFYLRCHRYEDAKADYTETLRLLGAGAEADMPSVVRARVGLAAVSAARGAWTEAGELLAVLRPQIAASGSSGSLAIADALDLEARLLGRSSGNAVRLRAHLRAFEIRTKRTAPGTPARARAHLAFVQATVDLGPGTGAEEHLEHARKILETELPLGSSDQFALTHLAGSLALANGKPQDAALRFREVVEQLQNERDADDYDLALARFDLARALTKTRTDDPEAKQLAQKALATLQQSGDGRAENVRTIEAWLDGE
ncbi:MAG: tetratricopeptide repeat protein, partial [Nannocystaceae bacterium]